MITRSIIFSVVLSLFFSVTFAQEKKVVPASNPNSGVFIEGKTATFYMQKSWLMPLLKEDYRKHYEANGLSVVSTAFEGEIPMELNDKGYYFCIVELSFMYEYVEFWFHSGGTPQEAEGRYLPMDIVFSGNGNQLYEEDLKKTGITTPQGIVCANFELRSISKLPF